MAGRSVVDMTHHDGTDHDLPHDATTSDSTTGPTGEAADFVHAVDHGDGTHEELTDGADKGDFTTSVDLGDGAETASNATRDDGEYISASSASDDPKGDDYVDPVDHG